MFCPQSAQAIICQLISVRGCALASIWDTQHGLGDFRWGEVSQYGGHWWQCNGNEQLGAFYLIEIS